MTNQTITPKPTGGTRPVNTKSGTVPALRDAGRKIIFHAPRMVRTWKLFTSDGCPVYCFGRNGFTLDPAAHIFQCTTYEDDSRGFAEKRLARASEKLGIAVKWREVEPTEMAGVSF
jgi:hypothetical protein